MDADANDASGGRSPEVNELRSYGRRRGRKLSPRQDRLMVQLLPRVSPELNVPADLERLFRVRALREAGPAQHPAGRETLPDTPLFDVQGGQTTKSGSEAPASVAKPVWLEIGFGGGEHLLWQARRNPQVGLIGAEPFADGVVKVLAAIEDEGLDNVRVHADDARALLRWLPEASIGRAFILFPDPWPKRRHVKRRLVNGHLLAMLARVMRPGAELRIATDIGDYARTMLMALQVTQAFRWTAASAGDWRQRPDDWPMTRYEAKAEREGRRSCYLRLMRT